MRGAGLRVSRNARNLKASAGSSWMTRSNALSSARFHRWAGEAWAGLRPWERQEAIAALWRWMRSNPYPVLALTMPALAPIGITDPMGVETGPRWSGMVPTSLPVTR